MANLGHVSETDLQRTVDGALRDLMDGFLKDRPVLDLRVYSSEIMTAAKRYAECYRADVPLPPPPDVDESIITTIEAGHRG